jgi:hypothetical protein
MLVYDTWAARDLPVLDATVSLLEHSYMVTVTDIAASTGLDPSVVAQALEALDPTYVDFRKTTTGGDPRFWYVFKVTPEARRVVGQWPTAEALAGRLAEELEVAARREADTQRQGLLVYAARLVGDTLREATVRAAGAVLAPAFGGMPVPEKGQPLPPPEPRQEHDFSSLIPLPELPELLRPSAQIQSADAAPTGPAPADDVSADPVLADARPSDAMPAGSAPIGSAPIGSVPIGPVPIGSVPIGPVQAVSADDDADSAATDLDLVQSGGDAATAR